MTCPLGDPVFKQCATTAHDGVFWRSNRGRDLCEPINVVVKFLGFSETPGHLDEKFSQCYEVQIMEPSLAEIYSTPSHDTHKLIDQTAILVIPSDFLALQQTIVRASELNSICCVIATRVQWEGEVMYILMNPSSSGLSVWVDKISSQKIRCAELFAGGYGGWSCAVEFLSSLGMDIGVKIAIDNDKLATMMFARNHYGFLAPDDFDPRKNEQTCPEDGTMVINTKVQLPIWYHLLFDFDIDVWFLSPPCPAFSKAGDMMGFLRADGVVTLEAICSIRLCQPVLVCLENVVGLGQGSNAHTLKAMMRWAGYLPLLLECNDASDISPTMRERFISCWIRKDHEDWVLFPKKSWFKAKDHSLASFGVCDITIKDEIMQQFILTQDVVDVYGNHEFVPKGSMGYQSRNDRDPTVLCERRCVGPSGKFRTFMALYGSQHELDEVFLLNKGLFAQLMQFGDHFRFIRPFEQCLAYATGMPFWIPCVNKDAFKFLGNAITPAQALYCMIKGFQACKIDDCPKGDAMLSVIQFITNRPNPSKIAIDEYPGWFLMYIDEAVPFRSDHELLMPEQLSNSDDNDQNPPYKREHEKWHCEDPECELGCMKVRRKLEFQEMSPTIPFTVKDSTQEVSQPMSCEEFGPALPQDCEFINVTVLLPADSFMGRYRKGTNISTLLDQEGFDPNGLVFRILDGLCISNDEPIVKDTTIVTIKDVDQHVHDAAGVFSSQLHQDWVNPSADNAINLTISHQGRVFWKGIMKATLPLQSINDAVQSSLKNQGISLPLRWSCRASPLNHEWGWKLCDLTGAGDLKIVFHFPFVGGGREAKVDENIKTQLMAELVGMGVSFSRLTPAITMIMAKHPINAIKSILVTDPIEKRHDEIRRIADSAGCTIAHDFRKREQAANKIQKAVRDKKPPQQKFIDLRTLDISEGCFLNEDSTPSKIQITPFEPNGQGLFVTTVSDVSQWLSSGTPICPDELGVLVLGHVSLDTKLQFQHIQFKAFQKGAGILLLKGTLIQLGSKKIHMPEGPITQIACPNTSVVTFTAFEDHFPETVWQDIVASPAKNMLNLFEGDARKQAILGVWGHSYQKDGKSVKPHQASSIQFHARIVTARLPELLRQSGWNQIFMVPKHDSTDAQPLPDQQYNVLWTGQPFAETQVIAKGIQATLGLVRSKGSFGIRVSADAFAEAWKKVHPHKDQPSTVRIHMVFRAQNMPQNITVVEVRQWLEALKWDAKPMKRIAQSTWLIGASKPPPSTSCKLNDNIILLQEQDKRVENSGPVLAGKPNFSLQSRSPQQISKGDDDPWSVYRERNGLSNPGPSQLPTRSIEGPTNVKFQEQDTKMETLSRRFEDLEKRLSSETMTLKSEMDNALQKQNNVLAEMNHNIGERFKKQDAETHSKFAALQVSIDSGRRAQDEQFQMIREMLAGHVSSARKSQKLSGASTPGGAQDDI